MSHTTLSTTDTWLLRTCLWIPLLALLLFFGMPMLVIVWKSFVLDSGQTGLGNYLDLIHSPGILRATINSLMLGVATTIITIVLAFILAYGLERTCMKGRRFVGMALSLPVLAPSLVLGLGLLFLMGRNGVIGKMLGIRMDMYGFWGLLIADVLYALPEAVMILRAAFMQSDARQYEAASVLGATRTRLFMDITLPGVRYGVLSAAFVVFSVTITDFGNAVVIGGNFSVLATEIYSQVNGQMRLGLGAAVGIVLLIPSVVAVWIERTAARRQNTQQAGIPLTPQPSRLRDGLHTLFGMVCAVAILLVILTVVVASFTELWPYKFAFTLKNYNLTISDGYSSLWTSLGVATMTAVIGTVLVFLMTFSISHMPDGWSKRSAVLLSALPVGVPGLVLGLSYTFSFNMPAMPWGALYGTTILVALCNFYHYHTQTYMTMMTGLRNVPQQLEDAISVLGGGIVRIMTDIYLPALKVVIIMVAGFLFMRSMVTLSAVIFLITPDMQLAATTIMRLDEAGLTVQAAAFCTCIMAIVGVVAFGLHLLQRRTHTPQSTHR